MYPDKNIQNKTPLSFRAEDNRPSKPFILSSYIDDSLHDKWHLAAQNIENYKNHPRGQLLAAVYSGLYCCSWSIFSILQIDAEMKFHECLLILTYSRKVSKWALQRWLEFQLEFLTVSIGFVKSHFVCWACVMGGKQGSLELWTLLLPQSRC